MTSRAKFAAIAALMAAAALSGCAATPASSGAGPIAVPITPSRPNYSVAGLEAIMGQDAGRLTQMFGQPRLDVVEVTGRKLQFSGKACVLDAYLYPRERGGRELVSHVDTRNADGAAVDRAACVAALSAR